MKTISDILQGLRVTKLEGDTGKMISAICFDSRKVTLDCVFVATRGTVVDGHKYITMALENGAAAIVCEELPSPRMPGVVYIQVENSAKALGIMCSNYFGRPSEKMKLIGVTGTNGKTTTATLLYQLFNKLGYKCGLISTVVYFVDQKELPATHTTPDALQLNALMASMVEAGCEFCFMEVSSHAIVQERIAGLTFQGAIFTNITHDHLDFHLTFDEYIKAKKKFFDELPKGSFALINGDDRNGKVMLQNTQARKYAFALKTMADFKCKIIESHFDGTLTQIDGIEVWTHFIGEFNAYNLLGVYATAILLEQNKDEILEVLSSLTSVSGRFEYIRSQTGITAIVDYAHTPDAIENVLKTIYQIRSGDQQIITVIGAGGDRDKTKRPIMAKVAAELSDRLILTSDNPRSEDPTDILIDMAQGLDINTRRITLTIIDRREAIKTAIALAKKGDIVLVAGKGHENYQEIKGVKHHFDDKEVIREIFEF
ncbi:MAG: UDP-N-acetylmuramoyl-L-alanyl-D-glutamate--2,6-diaminopimelate ligase [Bacteroidales bacterium]|nr:UDP-N-acetylmuramoyl-L-alanyl-D-glutamate--2,6-diaminopimelate ligase [Bacteroidales bacterium]